MKIKRSGIRWLWLFMLLCLPGQSLAADICGYDAAGVVEVIRQEEKIATFSVALADTRQQRRRGLMHCPALAPGTGLFFFYPQPGQRVFWMKNTHIELAIIFIADDSTIAAIAHGIPESLARLRSPGEVRHVLEIHYPESLDLAVGDRVRWRFGSGLDEATSRQRP